MRLFSKAGLLLSFLLSCSFLHAQDIILLTDGTIIRSVVLEVNETDILYRRYEEPDGVKYRLHLDKIRKINYQNGTEDVFQLVQPSVDDQEVLDPQLTTGTSYFQSFYRVGVSFLKVKMSSGSGSDSSIDKVTESRLAVDIVDDNRVIYPSGFLFSFQLGLGNRGWKQSDNYLLTHNVFFAARPGYSIRLKSNSIRIDMMTGLHVSYDLWGRRFDGQEYCSLTELKDFRCFDCGINAGVSLVLKKMELYFEYRRGLIDLTHSDEIIANSISYSIGIGWAF